MTEIHRNLQGEPLLKAPEIARILNISVQMVYKLMSTQQLPSIHIGRSRRVRPTDLRKYIETNLT